MSPFLQTLSAQPPQEPGASQRFREGMGGGAGEWGLGEKDPCFYKSGFVFVKLESPNKRP